jgi:hypothetical protein
MRSRFSFLLASLAFGAISLTAFAAGDEDTCPVTKAPVQQFNPPSGYHPYSGSDGRFLLGTADLWVLVTPHWKLGGTGRKLPYFSQNFVFGKSEGDPRLAVVARRLDSAAPLVWSDWVNGGGPSYSPPDTRPSDPNDHGFMVTSLPIPTAGCWEITARYAPAREKIQVLTYTVWVEP